MAFTIKRMHEPFWNLDKSCPMDVNFKLIAATKNGKPMDAGEAYFLALKRLKDTDLMPKINEFLRNASEHMKIEEETNMTVYKNILDTNLTIIVRSGVAYSKRLGDPEILVFDDDHSIKFMADNPEEDNYSSQDGTIAILGDPFSTSHIYGPRAICFSSPIRFTFSHAAMNNFDAAERSHIVEDLDGRFNRFSEMFDKYTIRGNRIELPNTYIYHVWCTSMEGGTIDGSDLYLFRHIPNENCACPDWFDCEPGTFAKIRAIVSNTPQNATERPAYEANVIAAEKALWEAMC